MRLKVSRRAAVWWSAITVLIAGVALLSVDAQACSVCVSWTDGQGLNGGFYWSALLLTALPFVVVAVIGVWLRAKVRRFDEIDFRTDQKERSRS